MITRTVVIFITSVLLGILLGTLYRLIDISYIHKIELPCNMKVINLDKTTGHYDLIEMDNDHIPSIRGYTINGVRYELIERR